MKNLFQLLHESHQVVAFALIALICNIAKTVCAPTIGFWYFLWVFLCVFLFMLFCVFFSKYFSRLEYFISFNPASKLVAKAIHVFVFCW